MNRYISQTIIYSGIFYFDLQNSEMLLNVCKTVTITTSAVSDYDHMHTGCLMKTNPNSALFEALYAKYGVQISKWDLITFQIQQTLPKWVAQWPRYTSEYTTEFLVLAASVFILIVINLIYFWATSSLPLLWFFYPMYYYGV